MVRLPFFSSWPCHWCSSWATWESGTWQGSLACSLHTRVRLPDLLAAKRLDTQIAKAFLSNLPEDVSHASMQDLAGAAILALLSGSGAFQFKLSPSRYMPVSRKNCRCIEPESNATLPVSVGHNSWRSRSQQPKPHWAVRSPGKTSFWNGCAVTHRPEYLC